MSSNPEKPPIPGQAPDQAPSQEPYYPTPAASGLPPDISQSPAQAQQHQHSDLPPAYPSDEQHVVPTEKGAAPAGHPAQQDAPHFPPPPPGPPPTHTNTGFSTASTNTSAFYKSSDDYEGPAPPLPGPRPSQQGIHNEKPIPAYNPAEPHFAPPPGQATSGSAHHQQQPPAYASHAHVQPQAVPGTGVAGDKEKSHRSWGSILSEMGNKAAIPINALANKMGSQSFLPTTMDRECEKAAHILKSFCKEGITSDHVEEKTSGETTPVDPKQKEKAPRRRGAIVKIPSKVIAKAQGLAIFTTARVGFQFSGATGSGVLIARRPDGSWSPPSGIQVHALGAGFMIGVDIYDCVCVINSQEALKAFMSTRVSLGPDVAVTAGPYGAGGVLDFGTGYSGGRKSDEQQRVAEAQAQQKKAEEEKLQAEGGLKPGERPDNKRRSSSRSFKPVFTYVKSRGFYAGVQVDGTIITERKEANATFYQQQVGVEQILRGDVPPHGAWMAGSRALYDALRVAETQQPLPEANLPPPAPVPAEPQVAQGPIATGQTPVGHTQGVSGQHVQDPAVHGTDSQYGGPPQMSGAGAGAGPGAGEALPGYVDDGVKRPGVGDSKVHYQ